MNDRYAGKPLLRLLECYVLQSIGELTPEDSAKLEAMTPKLRETYCMDGAWHEIVAKVMDFPATLPPQIDAIWITNRAMAASNDEELSPQDFAEMYVDENFPDAKA